MSRMFLLLLNLFLPLLVDGQECRLKKDAFQLLSVNYDVDPSGSRYFTSFDPDDSSRLICIFWTWIVASFVSIASISNPSQVRRRDRSDNGRRREVQPRIV